MKTKLSIKCSECMTEVATLESEFPDDAAAPVSASNTNLPTLESFVIEMEDRLQRAEKLHASGDLVGDDLRLEQIRFAAHQARTFLHACNRASISGNARHHRVPGEDKPCQKM